MKKIIATFFILLPVLCYWDEKLWPSTVAGALYMLNTILVALVCWGILLVWSFCEVLIRSKLRRNKLIATVLFLFPIISSVLSALLFKTTTFGSFSAFHVMAIFWIPLILWGLYLIFTSKKKVVETVE